MTSLTKEQILLYLELQGQPELNTKRLEEFMEAGEIQHQYDECVLNNYDLSDFDDWLHLQNILGVELDYSTAMKISGTLWDANISVSSLHSKDQVKSSMSFSKRVQRTLRKKNFDAFRTVDIYQLNINDPDAASMVFMNFEYLKAAQYPIERSKYNLVYSGPMYPGERLEDIYARFLSNPPKDFTGHSLGISDVITIHENGETAAYFINVYGFKEVPDFFDN